MISVHSFIPCHGFSGGAGYTAGKKHVLIMDEVDGMSGNEDRGGMQVWVHRREK